MSSLPKMDSREHFFQWDERQLAVGEHSTSYLENPWDKHSLELLKDQSHNESGSVMEIH